MKSLKNKKVKDLAIDEMKSYVSKKQNDFWVWTVVLDRNIKPFKVGKNEVKKFRLTNWNESLYSIIRDKLAMFRRKTKAYAKSIRAIERALALLFIYLEK